MTHVRVGQYRLRRQIHGRGAFGEVYVVVGPARAGDESAVTRAVAEGDRSIRPDTDPLFPAPAGVIAKPFILTKDNYRISASILRDHAYGSSGTVRGARPSGITVQTRRSG